ncbi:MAG TPA: peptidoglycan-binding domain-containing protein [Gemmatimonadaceae bacterium]|nr:peptidoglycan-binding domain-containing protein [Gemmatimonadaceae bacterium]
MSGALGLMTMLAAAPALEAQNRLALPRGSVILVRTTTALQSSNARVGQTFETNVLDSVRINGYTVIPAGSRIRGIVKVVQPATRQQSGVIEVGFDRLTLSDGTSFPIVGRLTSTDSAERRQIDASADQRVVLVGGRGGIGAAIAGAGGSSTVGGILGALGSLLSEAQDVQVPAGTPLAVQLEQRLVLRGRGTARRADASTIYTDAERIREAQTVLARLNYYRGPIDGELSYATQRALIEYQIDQQITATGNLDGRTAQMLGLSLDITGSTGAVLSAAEASLLRRNSQNMVARVRQELTISAIGRLDTRRAYSENDLELWFAISAFADNSSLYEQIARMSGDTDGAMLAGRALVSAARRVDAALQRTRPSTAFINAWNSTRAQLSTLDPSYR